MLKYFFHDARLTEKVNGLEGYSKFNNQIITTDPAFYARQQAIPHLVGQVQNSQQKLFRPAGTPKKPASASGLLNVDEAATYLHRDVSKGSIYKAINDGKLEAIRIGKSNYIRLEELEKFILCQDQENQLDCAKEMMTKLGSSTMEKTASGLDVVMDSLNKQRQSSKNT